MKHSQDVRNLIYVHVNHSDQYVVSHGLQFKEFMSGVPKLPGKLLLLQHRFEDGEFNRHTLLEYVGDEEIDKLLKEEVHQYGGFCWLDFEDEESLDQLEGQEIAELLYLSHSKSHLRLPFYRKLNNQFAYLAQDDGWFNKTYYRSMDDFYGVLGTALSHKLSSFKGEKSFLGLKKRKDYPVMPKEILYPFIEDMKEGLLFSIEKAEQSRTKIEIPIWVIGDFVNMDEMYEEYQNITANPLDGKIVFDRKTKEWKVFVK
ncbi:hypothetical protein [Falsibacillus pallidus]|uniref:Oxalate/formate antiporter n=1 Tax=Falsibacillus pallidus TaxID=493781 RepID=A0A370GA24_9BACI|nr:hypothetical protein [Falsibacillus pallidus]RDI39879.1 hypothetical protein DFR59_11436 [Falsibacillus pallidus]